MAFDTALTGYEKTGVSELNRAWQILGNKVAEQAGIQGGERTLLQIDEVMSWESVKNLRYEGVQAASRQTHLSVMVQRVR